MKAICKCTLGFFDGKTLCWFEEQTEGSLKFGKKKGEKKNENGDSESKGKRVFWWDDYFTPQLANWSYQQMFSFRYVFSGFFFHSSSFKLKPCLISLL